MTTGRSPQARIFGRARLRGRADLCDLHVADGRIVQIGASECEHPDVDLAGALVLPGLVEAHLHLEKAYLLDRMPREATSLADAIALTSQLKSTFTPADIRTRSLRLIRAAMGCGVTTVRAHVEFDDVLGLTAVEAILALREEVRDFLDLQVVAFPQEGLTSQRTARALFCSAIELGADVVGGIPYADDDPGEHLDLAFDLAERTGRPLDFHLDFSDDPDQLDIIGVAERTIARGLQGRVTVGHLTSLGSVEPARACAIADLIAQAGISVVALPATDVFLNGRADQVAPRRGLTPVRLLLEAGVNVALATNNVQNPFTPFGRGRITETASLLAALCHFGSLAETDTVVEMITDRAAVAVGLTDHAVVEGAPATFAVFDARTARDLLGDADRAVLVVKGGREIDLEQVPR
ncbi:MAG: Cytosine deaminase [Marmoricola sp.]|nr:Cytosine deaminase [Marmoricola sp.]